MSTKPTHPDPNESAARVVAQTLAKHEQPLPADVEAAWAEWSAGIAKVDKRTMTLLKAAFEAGVEAARSKSYQ
jgi:hypothetical protein